MADEEFSKWKEKNIKKQPEQKEVEELKKEVVELKSQLKQQGRFKARWHTPSSKWRNIIAVVLIVLVSLLAPISVTANWLNLQIVDTQAYVNTVAPLSKDPAIQQAVSVYITDELFKQVKVEDMVKKALPPDAKFISGSIVTSLEGFVSDQVKKVMATEQFNKLWIESNRIAHDLMVKALLPSDGVVSSEEGQVTLDLNKLLDVVKGKLSQSGVDIFGDVSLKGSKKIVLFKSQELAKIQNAVNILNKTAIFLPLIGLIFIAAAIAISTNRRRTIFWIGAGIAIATIIIIPTSIAIGEDYYLKAVSSDVFPKSAASAVYETIMASLKNAAWATILVGLFVAIGAFLVGPSVGASRVRDFRKNTFDNSFKGLHFGSFGVWVSKNKITLQIVGLITTLLILFLLKIVTPITVSVAALLYLIYLGLIEMLGRP